MNAKLQELLRDLLEGTRAGAFEWGRTPERGTYRLMLDKGLVRITRRNEPADKSFIGCTVLNSEGAELHDPVEVAIGLDSTALVQLYKLVEEKDQGGALDELLAEVRSKMQYNGRRALAGQK
jgi:hypothetical protein